VTSALPDHFALFGLAPRFEIDPQELARAHRALLSQVHPDRHALADAAGRRVALQWASRANEAIEVLRSPAARAAYLCSLHGVEVPREGGGPLPPAFLGWVMDWREALEEARERGDIAALTRLSTEAATRRGELEAALAARIDRQGDHAGAVAEIRSLVFVEKLAAEAQAALARAADPTLLS